MDILTPDWAAPAHVRALMTTRVGGVSCGAYGDINGINGFNPASHVGDDKDDVVQNRVKIAALVPNTPQWLNQTHGTKVWHGDYHSHASAPEADAVVIDQIGQVGAIMTADCLPVVFASDDGRVVAAAHAGWRGLVDGVLEQTVAVMSTKGVVLDNMHVWFGAAIGPDQFEVGQDVLDEFDAKTSGNVRPFFKPKVMSNNKYFADIYGLARLRLSALGITRVTGGSHCTVSEPERFYSYRRDKITGRMATLVWLDAV